MQKCFYVLHDQHAQHNVVLRQLFQYSNRTYWHHSVLKSSINPSLCYATSNAHGFLHTTIRLPLIDNQQWDHVSTADLNKQMHAKIRIPLIDRSVVRSCKHWWFKQTNGANNMRHHSYNSLLYSYPTNYMYLHGCALPTCVLEQVSKPHITD